MSFEKAVVLVGIVSSFITYYQGHHEAAVLVMMYFLVGFLAAKD